jgi:4-amino-4-deoxy-L-arabinose transferase-like glycosyltransferase
MNADTDKEYTAKPVGIAWWLGLAALILLSILLFFVNLGTPDFWSDEVLSQVKFANLFDNLKQFATDIHPPLYLLLSWGWNTLWGSETEAAFRSFSALIGVCCVVLVVILGNRLANRNFGLLAGLVVTVSPFFLLYGRMDRYYAIMAFFVLLALIGLWRRERNNLWWGFRCGLANLALIYVNYIGVIFILGQLAALPFIHPRNSRIWKTWILGHAIASVGFLPWIWVMLSQTARGNIAYQLDKAPVPFLEIAIAKSKAVILKLAYSGYVFFLGETTFPWMWVVIIPAVIVVLIGLGMLLTRHPSARNFRILLGYGLGVLVFVAILSEIYTRVFSFQSFALLPSRLLPLLPVLIIALTFGLYKIPKLLPRIILIVVFLATQAYGTYHYFAGDQYLNPKYNIPWKQVVNVIIKKSGGTAISCTDESSFQYYNQVMEGPPAYGVMDLLQGFKDIGNTEQPISLWTITRYRGDPGIRAAYRELTTFCHTNFPVVFDTSFAKFDTRLKSLLSRGTGDPAPDYVLSLTQYSVPFDSLGIPGIQEKMTTFLNVKPDRIRILGWIRNQ